MMKERKILILMGVGTVSMLAAAFFAIVEERYLLNNQVLLAREFEELELLESFAQELRDVRRLTLNYLISSDDAYQAKAEERIVELEVLLARLESSSGIDAPKVIDSLVNSGRNFLARYRQVITIAQAQGIDEAMNQVRRNLEAGTFDRLLARTEEMYLANLRAYTQLSYDINESARMTMLAIAAYIIIGTILMVGSIALILYYYRRVKTLLAETARLKRRLEQKVEEQETIISIISHDLRAPLVNIEGFAGEIGQDARQLRQITTGVRLPSETESAVNRLLSERIPESLEHVTAGVAAMNRLIKSLVEFGRAGQMPINLQHVDMNRLIGDILKTFDFRLEQMNAVVDVAPLPACQGDPLWLRQVFSNLIDNAVKYSRPDRRLRVQLTGQVLDGQAVYHIRDNGIGIEQENLDKIFSMYHQVARRKSEGSGLGLAIVKKLVERSGGTIDVQSALNEGSTFTVRLPA